VQGRAVKLLDSPALKQRVGRLPDCAPGHRDA